MVTRCCSELRVPVRARRQVWRREKRGARGGGLRGPLPGVPGEKRATASGLLSSEFNLRKTPDTHENHPLLHLTSRSAKQLFSII